MTAMITYSKDQCYTKEKQDMATMAKKFCPYLELIAEVIVLVLLQLNTIEFEKQISIRTGGRIVQVL